MVWSDFVLRLVLAFILGAGIGIERQWTKARSVLKINVLVSLGAAMFVMMAGMIPGDNSPTRVAAQVVSGIGFLGGGVILRDGRSVRGINTAATLWCAGAIGSLVGSGFFVPAYFGTLAVVGANLMLRPVVQIFNIQTEEPETREQQPQKIAPRKSHKIGYRCCLSCEPQLEAHTLTAFLTTIKERGLSLSAMESKNIVDNEKQLIIIEAEFWSENNEIELLGELINNFREKDEIQISSWKLLSSPT